MKFNPKHVLQEIFIFQTNLSEYIISKYRAYFFI